MTTNNQNTVVGSLPRKCSLKSFLIGAVVAGGISLVVTNPPDWIYKSLVGDPHAERKTDEVVVNEHFMNRHEKLERAFSKLVDETMHLKLEKIDSKGEFGQVRAGKEQADIRNWAYRMHNQDFDEYLSDSSNDIKPPMPDDGK